MYQMTLLDVSPPSRISLAKCDWGAGKCTSPPQVTAANYTMDWAGYSTGIHLE